jgi:uncharacterized phage-associated protein
MASVDDVAAAVIKRVGPVDTFKLQKLVYYCQAWSLVWDSKPLFTERIEAWANGPVVPALYQRHRREYSVSEWPWGDASALDDEESETVDAVVRSYGRLTGRQLIRLTHEEDPWVNARDGMRPGQRGNKLIELDAIAEYYSSIDADDDAEPVDEFDED